MNSLVGLSPEELTVNDDDQDFYGKAYWLNHQSEDLGFPAIHARARLDLTERNLHWLRALLKYKLPAANVLELGCSHGSFVALMRSSGYDASGVEMSPWVVEFGKRTFNVPIFVGPIEKLDIAPGSLDVIASMDVMEHLPDPVATLRHCLNLLKPDGMLLIQTPKFLRDMNYAELLRTNGPFLEQLKADEHLYLFTEESAIRLFRQIGAEHIQFEPAIFSQYDMFFAVSRRAFQTFSPEQINSALGNVPNGRIAMALLDLRERELISQADRIARGEQIETLTKLVHVSEADRAARGEQIVTLTQIVRQAAAKQAAQDSQHILLLNNLRSLYARPAFRVIAKIARWSETRELERQLKQPVGNGPLKIAVDLTPVLPGGENGGAKIFVLDLLRQLADMVPETQFVLLTQAASHDELATLDRPNMQRRMVLGAVGTNSALPRIKRLASRISPRVPARLKRVVSRLGYRLNIQLKRRGAGSLLRDIDVDLLFCPFTAPTYFEPGVPTVCTIYDLQYKTYPEFFEPDDVGHRAQTFNDAARRATALAAISDYSRQSAIIHGELDPQRIRTIHLRMGNRISSEAGRKTQVLGRLELTPQRYLVYPANFWKHKNHEILLTAFAIACRHADFATDIKLVCTGAPGVRQEWLRSATAAMNLDGRVVFPGYLPNEELAALISNCRGVVFPSLYEGFGLPVIEAMAVNVPVACSNTTSLPEVAADAAILFDPRVPKEIAQAMITLVCDEKRRNQLILAGRQRVEEFSDTRRMAREYWELFRSALANVHRENLIIGVDADGWIGSTLKVQTAPLPNARTLDLHFSTPDWLPPRWIIAEVYRDGETYGEPLKIVRGSEISISLPLSEAGGHYELRFTPTFIPASCGLGNDQRELSAILQRCSAISDNSPPIELLPEKASA